MTSLSAPSPIGKGSGVRGRFPFWEEKSLSLEGRSWKQGWTYSESNLRGGLTAGSCEGVFWAHVVIWIFSGRVTLDLPWGSSMAMISARPPFPALRLSTWALRICASSNPCWRSGWVMQVGDITCRNATSLGQDKKIHPGTSNKSQQNRSWSEDLSDPWLG